MCMGGMVAQLAVTHMQILNVGLGWIWGYAVHVNLKLVNLSTC